MKTGVYQIRNVRNNKLYIGSAAGAQGFQGRWGKHLRGLRKNYHHSPVLQNAWNKHGEESFTFEVLEECVPEKCVEREQHYLDSILFASCNDDRFSRLGYNLNRAANSRLGSKCSEETRAKMSASHLGQFAGEKNPMFGKRHSSITRERMSANHSDKSGECNAMAKLNVEQVLEIRRLKKTGMTQLERAKIFGVSRGTISDIDCGRRWRQLK